MDGRGGGREREEELSRAVSLLPIAFFFLPANWKRKDEGRRFARRSLREPRSAVSLDPSTIERALLTQRSR